MSDHITLQASNVATVTQGAKYDVEYYKILAIMDARTTDICRSMHGRIIPAKHLKKQADKILNAKSLADKKAATVWQSRAYLGKSDKMDSNFGLPPYHFRCRTEAIPVWVDEEEMDGVKMRNTQPLYDDEIVKHIDKTGVERYAKKSLFNHSQSAKSRQTPKDDIIKALNSINEMAPHKNFTNRTVAKSDNGYFIVFNGDEIYALYKPSNENDKSKKLLNRTFEKYSVKDKRQVIKWSIF